jgi:hypothetical protein
MVNWRLLHKLLKFAYHVLSPWQIGSTLVWLLDDNDPFKSAGIDLEPLRLRIDTQLNTPSLSFAAHLLAQHDGATIVAQDGRLLRTGIHLTASNLAHEIVKPLRGTRHTSAKRASFDHPNTVVVAVSSDGPVTIFSDGMSIFELGWYSATDDALSWIKTVGKSHEDDFLVSGYDAKCSRCGKTSEIEELTVVGWREDEEALCPVCNNVVATGLCWKIDANLKKVF